MSLITDKIDYILTQETTIKKSMLSTLMTRQENYGDLDTTMSLEITKLFFLLNNYSWFDENLLLALYKKMVDYLRKNKLIYKIPEIAS